MSQNPHGLNQHTYATLSIRYLRSDYLLGQYDRKVCYDPNQY